MCYMKVTDSYLKQEEQGLYTRDSEMVKVDCVYGHALSSKI